jgi:predicted PurR-regulated permease PerM
MPDYLVLIATLGGLTVFGVSGFVIGPIIAALFLTVWEMFEQEHRGGAAHGTASPDEVKIIVPKG